MALQSIANRFWGKVAKLGPGECWPWLGAVQSGYGIFIVTSRPKQHRELAHRVAAKLAGMRVDDRDTVKHSCGQNLCCNPAHLYLKVRPIAEFSLSLYNAPQRDQSPQESELDELAQRLVPLRNGHPVVLAMDDPVLQARKMHTGPKQRLVSIVPGPLAGFKDGYLLVSVIELGSALVNIRDPHAVTKLVLAKMPAKLARVLMNRIHQVLKER